MKFEYSLKVMRAVLDTKRKFSFHRHISTETSAFFMSVKLKIVVLHLKLIVGFLLPRPFDNAWSLLKK